MALVDADPTESVGRAVHEMVFSEERSSAGESLGTQSRKCAFSYVRERGGWKVTRLGP